ncbi:MAG: biopolymer transporter ExbD [Planctomycetota bacterium]
MRRQRARKKRPGTVAPPATARVNVTPMIDVVMVLIVFFLLVGHLANERRGAVDLPIATQGEDEDSTRRPVVILVEAGGRVRIDGVDVPDDSVVQRIASRVAASQSTGRPGGVHVRADASTAFADVRPILDACRSVGITEVRLAVHPEWAQ